MTHLTAPLKDFLYQFEFLIFCVVEGFQTGSRRMQGMSYILKFLGSWALKTNRICALDDIFDSTAMGFSISIRIFDFLYSRVWIQTGNKLMQGMSYILKFLGSWALKTNRICALDDIFDSTAMGFSLSIRIFDYLHMKFMAQWWCTSRSQISPNIKFLLTWKLIRCLHDGPAHDSY